ncbi:radical SAM family heme chaperone HemW [Leptospira sp. GIMC2001]|uniref:radical SAM family heme chaperone HemW n=1 Tax=Leptospira sp. GIMC2001 TaxID=1513297 RepID=UPI00234AB4F1|nr:radical SAM family heme chaperone HemW [Leptospira sp. GIMC2001]WCL50539.1 radical SAM family heme chaperone HemW [Leptospira sp. GIMC2001]
MLNILGNQTAIKKREGYLGIYVHFPFCIQKCSYCDFYSIGNGISKKLEEKNIFSSYKTEILNRIESFPEIQSLKVDSLFFGGGTPSRMDNNLLNELIHFLRSQFQFEDDIEMSIESNPEDITESILNDWNQIGINRVNMGYQTQNPQYLELVGRYYDSEQYKIAPLLLANSKIENYGFDLIYGFPNQTEEEFYSDLEFLLQYKPNHLSLYSLTLEKGTEYSRQVKDRVKLPPNEDLQIKLLETLPGKMQDLGYKWYEVSNYCKLGFESRHNLKYWTMEKYLAIGPGAHGFINSKRYSNPRNLEAYTKHPGKSNWEESDPIPELLLSLFRIFKPIDMNSFINEFPIQAQKKFLTQLNKFQDQDYCKIRSDGIFQWQRSAILNLDNLIFELNQAIRDH